jgi:hypothetical protein
MIVLAFTGCPLGLLLRNDVALCKHSERCSMHECLAAVLAHSSCGNKIINSAAPNAEGVSLGTVVLMWNTATSRSLWLAGCPLHRMLC